jgi:hypothetical protein
LTAASHFPDLNTLATHLRQELQTKKFILLYPFNPALFPSEA